MAYVIKVVSTKPEGTFWYSQSGISGAIQTLSNILAWDVASTGYISSDVVTVSNNVIEGTIIFDSKINGDAWHAAAVVQADHVVRDTYLQTIGVTQVITMTIL